jgi:hypothetical protein
MTSYRLARLGAAAAALAISACNSPVRTIRPVIHARPEDKYAAMKSAPVIVIAEVLDYKLISGPHQVERPSDALNPRSSMIPLHLARMSANVLFSLRGGVNGKVQFYSWVWASGDHGGYRLFRPFPGYIHLLFLHFEGGYLHTVGDYPAYDLLIRRSLVPAISSRLMPSPGNPSDLFERIVAACITADLGSAPAVITRDDEPADMEDLVGLTSPFYVASRLDSICRNFPNRFGRFAACMTTANEFYGRCRAYSFAREGDTQGVEATFVTEAHARCEAWEPGNIAFLRERHWPIPPDQDGWRITPERHRLAMRLYASALDDRFRAAACESAATMPEARDIPECSAPVSK